MDKIKDALAQFWDELVQFWNRNGSAILAAIGITLTVVVLVTASSVLTMLCIWPKQ